MLEAQFQEPCVVSFYLFCYSANARLMLVHDGCCDASWILPLYIFIDAFMAMGLLGISLRELLPFGFILIVQDTCLFSSACFLDTVEAVFSPRGPVY